MGFATLGQSDFDDPELYDPGANYPPATAPVTDPATFLPPGAGGWQPDSLAQSAEAWLAKFWPYVAAGLGGLVLLKAARPSQARRR